MILPKPCSLMMFQAALEHLQAPYTWTLKIRFQSSSFIFWKEISRRIPALLRRTSTLPKASTAVLMIFSPNQTESQLATAIPPFALISSTTLSAALALLPCPLWEVPRSLTTTLAPRLAKKRAYSLPIPPPAPVTTTTLPSNLSVMIDINNKMMSYILPLKFQRYWVRQSLKRVRFDESKRDENQGQEKSPRQKPGKSILLMNMKMTTPTKNQNAIFILLSFSSSFFFSPFTYRSAFFNCPWYQSYIAEVLPRLEEVFETPTLMLPIRSKV